MEQEKNERDEGYVSQQEVLNEFETTFPTQYRDFTEEDYYRLQQNLIAFKEGDKEAITYIVSTFHQFLSKYARFICNGKITEKVYVNGPVKKAGNDKTLSLFVKLFMSSEKTDKSLATKDRHKHFGDTCNRIVTLFSKYDYWDIYNELVCALLNMAKKYKITKEGDEHHKKNGTFHMYVNKCFHFEAYNTLKKLIDDPLTHFETYHIYEDCSKVDFDTTICNKYIAKDDSPVCYVNHKLKAYSLKDPNTEREIEHFISKTDRENALVNSNGLVLRETKEIDPYDTESLNFNWTNGITCSDLFDCLTSYERELLVLSFVQNKTDSEIARLYNCHRITIVKHKKAAVLKISEIAKKKRLI